MTVLDRGTRGGLAWNTTRQVYWSHRRQNGPAEAWLQCLAAGKHLQSALSGCSGKLPGTGLSLSAVFAYAMLALMSAHWR